jgi:formamidopyrimidine-DNA glycosylase
MQNQGKQFEGLIVPELPEVEIIRRRIIPYAVGQTVAEVIVRNASMRRPVSAEIASELPGQTIHAIERRGKYLLFRSTEGNVILHLGMTGFLQALDRAITPGKHDHLDIVLSNGVCLRLNDYRRFGLIVWTEGDPLKHQLLAGHGPEPFDAAFNGAYLYTRSRERKAPVRHFIMDQRIVAGIGNIYANEALFLAGIHPARRAGRISRNRYEFLAQAIRTVLQTAIEQGGIILDSSEGSEYPKHFRVQLLVYNRAGESCPNCGALIQRARLSQRSHYFCRNCQR